MAWNTRDNKDVAGTQEKAIGPGAPTVYETQSTDSRGYSDGWDIERAFNEGGKKVTWVFRCIDAIAGNQARLPMIFRADNSPQGEITQEGRTLELLNQRANVGEDSFAFRYRLSSQLLLSTRGVFIEVIRGNDGNPTSLNLLPPQSTRPVPHKTKFVSHYVVELPEGVTKNINPDDVVWIRRPHPLDPYLSLTPLEAAGIAVEIENLARLYNRNFLVNDGRPGGLLVLRGEIGEDDKQELTSRFRGNINRAGSVSVISSDDGADFVDTASNPRDASYIQMRQITKEEILAAFGVPESIIGNASGRTFSNAAEEGRVFWMETMMPHLESIARGLDILDADKYIDFDLTAVPILILAQQEQDKYYMEEFTSGVISANEYREKTSRSKVKAELSDGLLVNPNLTQIGNTEKELKTPPPPTDGAGGGEGIPANAPLDVQSGETPVMRFPKGAATDGSAGDQLFDDPSLPNVGLEDEKGLPFESKRFDFGEDFLSKTLKDSERWEQILDRSLERFFERQQRVVLEKVKGKKARAALVDGTLSVDQVFNSETWDRQLVEDLRPILQGIVTEAAETVAAKAEVDVDVTDDDIQEFLDAQVEHIQKTNERTKGEIASAILVAKALVPGDDDEDDGGGISLKTVLLVAAITAIFVGLLTKNKDEIVDEEALTAYNAGLYFSAKQAGVVEKVWVSRGDASVRSEHRALHGNSVGIAEGFKVDGATIRFPKDPLAPVHLTKNCRCTLSFRVEPAEDFQ